MSSRSSRSSRSGSRSRSRSRSTSPQPRKPVKPVKRSPQGDVDRFWQKFTTNFPGKVESVLPSNIYAKSKANSKQTGTIPGHRSGKSYREAAAECKDAVLKIAKECRSANVKYRDPHFDIEFDLKGRRRDCLDGLNFIPRQSRFWPRAVKRVADLFQDPKFYLDEATASDIRQGFNGDCWFLAAVCAITGKKDLIDKVCVARDEKVGVYGFVFHRDGQWFSTIIDDKLFLIAPDWWESNDADNFLTSLVNRESAEEEYRKLNQTGSKALYFAQCRSANETWLPLLEKAYSKAHGDYSAINGGFTGEGIEDLTGGISTELFATDILDKDKFWTEELAKVNDKFLFGCYTGTYDDWQGSKLANYAGARSGVVHRHAYSIMDAVEVKGIRLVKVRNPWARDEWRGAWSDGSEQWNAEWLGLLDHKFGDDGIFWISYEDLLQKYSTFERIRLFDDEWQVAQQWTKVDVPWSADYSDTKFKVTLSKRSSVVIALSQLDDRYFKGLAGQYIFELQFRVDKDGSSEDVIRSRANYNMRRTVSTDIELDPGSYSILMKVTATRYNDLPTVEDIIKDNVRGRQNKLIQVGLSYDLAHAKGAIKESAQEKQDRKAMAESRKKAEKDKMRKQIRAEKFQDWQKGKRLYARNKRHAQRKEAYLKKKAEKKAAEEAAAKSNAEEDWEDEEDADGDGANESKGKSGKKGAAPEIEEQVATPAESSSGAADNGKSGEDGAEPEIKKAEDEAEAEANGEENADKDDEEDSDAYMYESDASFVSSIDSLLDFPDEPVTISDDEENGGDDGTKPKKPTRLIPRAAPTSADDPDADPDINDPTVDDADDDDDDAASDASSLDSEMMQFAYDPWNAVCVVGLRVYSKDAGCTVEVIRPRVLGGPDSRLDLDDASRGLSGAVGKGEGGEDGKVEGGAEEKEKEEEVLGKEPEVKIGV